MAVVEISTGMILMWSGAIVDIPAGFALCSGANGTPDLRSTFIVGAGDTYDVGDAGGNTAHNHPASGTIVDPYLDFGSDIAAGNNYSEELADDAVTVVVQNANHIPPYYALAYIMKT